MEAAAGFVGAAAGVAALRQNYVNLKSAVDSGQVMIKPDAAANAAKACRDQKDRFVEFRRSAQELARHAQSINFGDCDEGRSMRQVFHGKAQGGPNSAYDLFQQAAEIMENMAQTYEAAGKMYQDTDQGNAQAFKGKM